MLVLSRKVGEKVVIGHDIEVTVLELRGNQVKIGIQAPDSVMIVRAELVVSNPTTSQETDELPKKLVSGNSREQMEDFPLVPQSKKTDSQALDQMSIPNGSEQLCLC